MERYMGALRLVGENVYGLRA